MMNKKYLIIKIVILGVCLLVAVWYLVFRTSISESGSGLVEVDGGQRVIMGTYCRVVAVAENEDTAKKCIEAAFKKLRDVDAAMSVQRDDSEISEINRNAFNEPVRISKPTFAVLQKAIEFSKLTDGAFDVTLGPLVDLWDSAAKAGSVPSDTELQQVRSKIGYEKLILDAEEMTQLFEALRVVERLTCHFCDFDDESLIDDVTRMQGEHLKAVSELRLLDISLWHAAHRVRLSRTCRNRLVFEFCRKVFDLMRRPVSMIYRFEATQPGFPSEQLRLLERFHGDIVNCLRERDRRALLSALDEQADTFESRVANALIHGRSIGSLDFTALRSKRGLVPITG